ncbi:hypothetical protein [Absidia glauca]|uniref:Uncharacterized protein n=1 Tax=Absidia glauca TaxID=4829 RepID=A0A168T018_ABSGL|nr:hypothetical protein [Absidia glauca]
MILDGGCTPCIISRNLAIYLEFTELDAIQTQLMMASGNTVAPRGVLKNLQILVGNSKTIEVDAICLDVQDYGFINDKEVKLAVSYQHTQLTGNSTNQRLNEELNNDGLSDLSDDDTMDTASSYLVAFAGLAETTDSGSLTEFDNRLGSLPERIRSNQVIKELGIMSSVMDLITSHVDCFGTNYEHLKQTGVTELHVKTGDHQPIYRRPYGNLSSKEKEFLQAEVTQMVNNGIIIPTT